MAWASTVYGLTLCAVAGVSGAGAAVFGKLAGAQGIDTATQITCYALLILCNALMLILYTRSLRYNSSLACTAATTAVNISATGLLGSALFGEATSLQWWVGASSILVGSVVINRSSRKQAAAAAAAAEAAEQPGAEEDEEEGQPREAEEEVRLQQGCEEQQGAQAGEGERLQNGGAEQPAGDPPSEEAGQLWYSYAVTLAYDGTDYWGWQLQAAPTARPASGSGGRPAKRQPRPRPTIQLRLEQALAKVTGEPREVLKVQAAGRTDAGVHARGQVAQFFARRRPGRPPLAPHALLRALNALLPPDVRALAAREVPLGFNVRYALRKTYSYDLDLSPAAADPLLHRFRHRPRRPEALRLGAMADAARLFVGTHNFANFANVSADGSHARKDPVKTILRYELLPIEGGARLEVEGTGFLYKQVRHMTGALLAVGAGQLGPDAISAALAAGGEARTGAERHSWRGWMVAEAKGLCLQAVEYPAASELLLPSDQQLLLSSDDD